MGKRLLAVTFVAALMALVVFGRPPAPGVEAAATTSGLKALSVGGVGTGTLATDSASCGSLACAPSDTCTCITGSDTVLGNLGFNNGSLAVTLLVDTTGATSVSCSPAVGTATLANKKGNNSLTMNLAGEVCPTLDITTPTDAFNGAYVVTGGSGKYSSSSGGSGSISGSQAGADGLSYVSLNGSVQPVAPIASPSGSPTASPSGSPTASASASPIASPSASASASPIASPSASASASPIASPSATASPVASPSAAPSESPSASPSPAA